jgi:NADPH2:quinone reductase
MTHAVPESALQLRSLVTAAGELQLSLVDVPVPNPGPDEVLIRIEASPINPSDIGLLFGPADMANAKATGTPQRPVITAPVPAVAMAGLAARLGQSMPVGNEGAGVVVGAGASPQAQALLGKTVAAYGGAMYAQYRCVPLRDCLLLR